MTIPGYGRRNSRFGEDPSGWAVDPDAGSDMDAGLGRSLAGRASESLPKDSPFDDVAVTRQNHLQSLINRAMPFCNRVEIENATWEDDKNFIYCNDPAIEAELLEECRSLDAELSDFGMCLGIVASGLERGEFFYDARFEDPIDLEMPSGALEVMDDFDSLMDSDWGDE